MLVRNLTLCSIKITDKKIYLFMAYEEKGQWVDHHGQPIQPQSSSFIRHLALFKAELNKTLEAHGYYLVNIIYPKKSLFPALVIVTEDGEKSKDNEETIKQFITPVLLEISQTTNSSPSSPKLFDYPAPARARSAELPSAEKVLPLPHKSNSAKK